MPDIQAMQKAIRSFCCFLSIKLIEYSKKAHNGSCKQLPQVVSELECLYLIPTLEKASEVGIERDDHEKIGWRNLASAYQEGMQKVLNDLIEAAKNDNTIRLTFYQIWELVLFQHGYQNLKKYLEIARNPPDVITFTKAKTIISFASAPQEKGKNYFPITEADLMPFTISIPEEISTFDMSDLSVEELAMIVSELIKQHQHRVAHYPLLMLLTTRLSQNAEYRQSQKIFNVLHLCRRTDGNLADYSYDYSLTKWFFCLHDLFFPNQVLSGLNDKYQFEQYFDLLFHEAALWNSENCPTFFAEFEKLPGDNRLRLLINFIEKSGYVFQRRELHVVRTQFFDKPADKFSDQLFIPKLLSENIHKLFLLINQKELLQYSSKIISETITLWGHAGLFERANLIPQALMEQQTANLISHGDERGNTSHERNLLDFLGVVRHSSIPYVLRLFKAHPYLLKRTNVIQAILGSHVLCRAFNVAETDSEEAILFLNVLNALVMMPDVDFQRIIFLPREFNTDYQDCVEKIFTDHRIKKKITNNLLLAQQCVVSNLFLKFSLELIKSEIFDQNDLIFLLQMEKTGELTKGLLEQNRVLQNANHKKGLHSLSEDARSRIDVMLRTRQSLVDNEQKLIGLSDELIKQFSRYFDGQGSMAKLLEANTKNYIQKHLKLIIALLHNDEMRKAFRRDILIETDQLIHDLSVLLQELDKELLFKLLQDELSVQEKIASNHELAKLAIKKNISNELTLHLLGKIQLADEELCTFISETKDDYARSATLALLKQSVFNIPIQHLNQLLSTVPNKKEVLKVVAERYIDVDIIRSLFASFAGNELLLLSHFIDNDLLKHSVLENITLTDLLQWTFFCQDRDHLLLCVRHFIIPMLHALDKKKESKIIKESIKKLIFRHPDCALLEYFCFDEQLRKYIGIDEIIIMFEHHEVEKLAVYIEKINFNIDQSKELLAKSDKLNKSQTEILICSLIGIFNYKNLSKEGFNADKLSLSAVPQNFKLTHYYLAVIKKVDEFKAKLNDAEFKGFFNSAGRIFKKNAQLLEEKVLTIIAPNHLHKLLLSNKLTYSQLRLTLSFAVKKEALTDTLLTSVLRLQNWNIIFFGLWIDAALAERLKTLALKMHGEEKKMAFTRILLAQIVSKDGLDRPHLNSEERGYLIHFLTRKYHRQYFQMDEDESNKLFNTITNIIAKHRCTQDEIVSILENYPELSKQEYNLLRPVINAKSVTHFAELLKIPVAKQVASIIIRDLLKECKILPTPEEVVAALKDNVSEGYIARALAAYQQLEPEGASVSWIKEITEEHFIKLKVLSGSLIHFRSKLLYPSEPKYRYELSDKYLRRTFYVDQKWLQPIIRIELLIHQEHHRLRGKGWLIDPIEPHLGYSPDKGEQEQLPISKGMLDEIEEIITKTQATHSPPNSQLLERRAMQRALQ